VANPDSEQVLFLDDAKDASKGTFRLKGTLFDGKSYDITREMFGGKSVIIGQGENDCGLELGPQVEPEHVHLNVGSVQRNLHIWDGITRGGTRAFIPTPAYQNILNHHVP